MIQRANRLDRSGLPVALVPLPVARGRRPMERYEPMPIDAMTCAVKTSEPLAEGADCLVFCCSITAAPDPSAAARRIVEDLVD